MASAWSAAESASGGQRAVGTAGSMFVRVPHAHGVRRRREEAVEIEELDSHTMRQRSYNYFQRHGQVPHGAAAASGPSLLRSSTFRSSLGRSPASRKRQRTLAEQLDELCLQGSRGRASGVGAAGSARSRSRSHSRGRTRGSRRQAERASCIVELDDFGREKQASVDGSASGSDSDSDGMTDASRPVERGVRVYGDAHGSSGLRGFFAAGPEARHRPMDRMYRHYVAIAAATAASQTSTPQGNELVVFRAPSSSPDVLTHRTTSFTDALPAYLSLTPREFEKLSVTEKRQWYQVHSRYMRQLDDVTAEHKGLHTPAQGELEAKPTAPSLLSSRRRSSSESSGRSFGLMGVPDTDEGDVETDELEDEDVEMMEDVDGLVAPPKQPHPAGAISHTEWFADEL